MAVEDPYATLRAALPAALDPPAARRRSVDVVVIGAEVLATQRAAAVW